MMGPDVTRKLFLSGLAEVSKRIPAAGYHIVILK